MTIAARQALTAYRRKRDFDQTEEPAGDATLSCAGRRYVMHKHAASHDLMDVLKQRLKGKRREQAAPAKKAGKRKGSGTGELESKNLESKNKTQLYELAQAMDIGGRSSMSKAELVAALTGPRK